MIRLCQKHNAGGDLRKKLCQNHYFGDNLGKELCYKQETGL